MAAPAATEHQEADGATGETKHRRMQERFLAQQEARLQARQASRAQGEALKDPKESVGLFWSQFRDTHDEVTRALNALVQAQQEGVAGSSGSGSQVQEALAGLLAKIEALEQRITDAALFLPPYDVRRAQEESRALRDKLEAARAASAPRKKFSFAARRQQQQQKAVTTAIDSGGGVEASLGALSLQPMPQPEQGEQQPPAQCTTISGTGGGGSSSTEAMALAMKGFEGREGEELDLEREMGPEELPRNLLLQDLRRCTVRLLAPLSFLRMEGLRDCLVLCGPVAGPVYLEGCKGCTVHLASRQLRIHNTEACDLYVHTVSGPIIEDCDRLRFAPYALTYPGLEGHLATAQLAGTRNAWNEVKDFKWLRAQQSPHWSVLPEEERKGQDVAVEKGGREAGKKEAEEEEEI